MKNAKRRWYLPALAVLVAGLVGVDMLMLSFGRTAAPIQAPASHASVSFLEDASMLDPVDNSQQFHFKDGRAEIQVPMGKGDVATSFITHSALLVLKPGIPAVGDIDGDEVFDYAAIVSENTGGNGQYAFLAVFKNNNGRPVYIASANLGDRVSVERVAIIQKMIYVDVITQGPGEAMCCGTLHKTLVYRLVGGALAETRDIPAVSTEGWKTYSDPAAGFSIQYPPDIQTVAVDDPSSSAGSGVTIFLPDSYGAETDWFGGGISIRPMNISSCSPSNFDISQRSSTDIVVDQSADAPSVVYDGVTLAGTRVLISEPDDSSRTDTKTVYALPHGPQCFELLFHTYRSSYRGTTPFYQDYLMPVFKAMIGTLRFTGPAEPTLSVTYPKGGERFMYDAVSGAPVVKFLWNSTNASSLTAYLSLEGENGDSIPLKSDHVNRGYYDLYPQGDIPAGSYRFKVTLFSSNSTPVVSGVSQVFDLVLPDLSANSVSGWHAFVSPQYGFQIQYPSDFKFTSDQTYGSTTVADLVLDPSYFDSSDASADVRSSVSVDKDASCVVTPDDAGYHGYSHGTFQGLAGMFLLQRQGDAGMSQYYDRKVFTILHDGLCYHLEFTVHTVNLGVFDWTEERRDAVERERAAAIDKVWKMVDQVAASMKFLKN